MSYYPPPPGVGGAQNSLPPRPQLDFRPPPPSGPGGGRRGGGGDRGGYSGGRSRQARGGRDNSYGSNSAPGGSRNNHHQSFAPPPRSDFTFRADKPVGVQEAQQRGGNDGGDHYAPRDGPRRDRFRGRQGDFVGKGNEGTTYLNLDDLSDSDEAEMDISGDEDGNAEGEDASENDDGDAPPRKRARRSEKSSAKEEPLAPKWSNPDPYTVLPPTEGQGGVKKKDVVQLIRKARVKAERAAAETSADTEEFISCGMDSSDDDGDEIKLLDDDEDNEDELKFNDDDDDDDDEEDGEVQSGDDDLGRVNLIGRNGKLGGPELSAASLSHNTTHAPASSSSAPPDAPRGPRGSKQQQAAPSSLAADLNTSRKRTHDDELKPLLLPNHAILKRVNKMPVGGYIVPGWQPKASEPPCPWISEQDDASSGELTSHMGVWLHKEITDFYEFVRPQDFEEALRQALLDDLDASVRKRFPNGRINCFGSFMSGLYLPTGDMDIVMCSTQFLGNRPPVFSKKGHLFKFGSFLCQNRLAEREHLEHITKAKVPLVKYIDLKTGLKVDVSFENMNGVVANKTFADWKKQFPEMPILVTMIKQFLAMRGLNEPVNGGIGGFSVICLVVSMLQMMPPMQSKDMVGQNHLGDLLMHFFDLYGNKFNYEATAISLNPPGYIPKSKVRNFTYKNPDRLSIIDPNNEDNDISGGSKNTPAIMREFAEAYDALQKRMVDLAKLPLDQRAHQSILGVILQGDYSTYRHQRDYLREVYVREFKREPRAY
ncbi:poly rna polymerase cid14 [Ophiostoma piceae UAMH 11346]|uniref:polynucleotide adenylyltransferase n=1 Tax=Ophiostoma piceae (strain UAMH 11346) TaxID=1262450 RepID=S3CPU4_OPHP1|nr:poly rna polymerase cid14 [Ophiostoma piceae UAMH 11346]